MGDRGTGRTTKQLKEAMSHLAQGRHVAFVCRTAGEADYTASLMASLAPPDKMSKATKTLHYGPTVIQMKSLNSDVGGIQGWRGNVIFDHSARPDIGASEREWRQWDEWNMIAQHVNSKEELP